MQATGRRQGGAGLRSEPLTNLAGAPDDPDTVGWNYTVGPSPWVDGRHACGRPWNEPAGEDDSD